MGSDNNSGELNQGRLKNGQVEEIRNLLQLALADGRISTREIAQVQFFYYDSDLSPDDFATLKTGVFQQVVQAAIADRQVTEQEQKAIIRIAKQLGISGEWKEWAREQIQSTEATD
jgi:uncharacterized tellurite resistance protein B-like protein